MNLNEAFRYSKHLANLNTEACNLIRYGDNFIKTEMTFYKSKAISGGVDEVEVEPRKGAINCGGNKILDLLDVIQTEMEDLSIKINNAKSKESYDILKENNARRKNYIIALKVLANLKSMETFGEGRDYTFNVDGNQVSYTFKTKTVRTIDFDRNNVRDKIKSLSKESDVSSNEIARLELSIVVEHEPKFDLNDTLQDLLD